MALLPDVLLLGTTLDPARPSTPLGLRDARPRGRSLQHLARGQCPQAVGLVVPDELFLGWVETQLAAQQPRQRSSVAGDVRAPHDLRVGGRTPARLDAVEEV